MYRSNNNEDSSTNAYTGLISTDVAALAVDSNYHVFPGTHSVMDEVECFDPATGDIWTQNGGFPALYVNSVVINSISHIFAGAGGGVFPLTNDDD